MKLRPRALAALVLLPLLAVGSTTGSAAPSTAPTAVEEPDVRVLAISVDGLNPTALTRLGRAGLPHLWRLLDEGAATLNARSQYEATKTLPNHTSMVTGRRINPRAGGHGVAWNYDRPGPTVQQAAGGPVSSVFSEVARAGGSSALFATKGKFRLFTRSWPAGVDRTFIRDNGDLEVVKAARADLISAHRDLTFLHLGVADHVGHEHGFMSPAYLRAVTRVDTLVGRMLGAIEGRRLDDVVVVLTADHGGVGPNHIEADQLGDYRIPFVVWGPGVAAGDLYAMNPTYVEPGRSRPRPTGPQPIRDSDLANLVTDLLGLRAVPGSQFDVEQRLRVLAE